MSGTAWATSVLLALTGSLIAGLSAWRTPTRRLGGLTLLLVLLAGAVAAAAPQIGVDPHWLRALLLTVAAGCAVTGGGPLTTLVFDSVDRREPGDRLREAGQVLRGGAWIGGLERLAVFATLVAGWPEGLAVVLAVKGLGRYPELRAAEEGVRTGAAERFIIGTLVSVLWAAACAGIVVLTLGTS